MQLESI